MTVLLLFLTFFKISLFSLGGGYNMIPMMQHELEAHGWLEPSQFLELFALSEATPGPVAVNAATLAGAKVAGPFGALAATTGACMPGFLLASLAGAWLLAHRTHPDMLAIFRYLPAVLAGLILATTFRLFLALDLTLSRSALQPLGIMLLVFLACHLRPRLSPVIPLLAAAGLSVLLELLHIA
jgi:chromate transporter